MEGRLYGQQEAKTVKNGRFTTVTAVSRGPVGQNGMTTSTESEQEDKFLT